MKYQITLTLEAESIEEALEEARYRFYTHETESSLKDHGVELEVKYLI